MGIIVVYLAVHGLHVIFVHPHIFGHTPQILGQSQHAIKIEWLKPMRWLKTHILPGQNVIIPGMDDKIPGLGSENSGHFMHYIYLHPNLLIKHFH